MLSTASSTSIFLLLVLLYYIYYFYLFFAADTELIGNPTDSTRSADLLDLDSVQNSSMNQLSFDLLDSNWLSTSDTRHFNLNPTSNDEIPDVSQMKRKAAKPSTTSTKVGKRRHSSQASELELQIEIEESTKRTKVGLSPSFTTRF